MPRCVPLARRTRHSGHAGTRGDGGGTPSESRVRDFWNAARTFLGMFPGNQGFCDEDVYPCRHQRLTCPCRRTSGGVSFARAVLMQDALMKKFRFGSVYPMLIGLALVVK